ncbi:hypothetical protein HAHE_31990 [Haloferula helveola]|uniref:Uncharacterized protein n=1 Tax=Haloferula helveola TaxID=490095 RepID=A0ABM7RC76_9BACT|nr:hypothetical protein HAHE_31990 [Haloferula helveola]
MKRDLSNEPLEKDPIWDLLRQSPRHEAGPRFADDVVRAARLSGTEDSWWKRLWVPLTVGGLATAATAAIAIFVVSQQSGTTPTQPDIVELPAEAADSFAALDEMVRTEALLVAAEHPSEFSDAELVSLITY